MDTPDEVQSSRESKPKRKPRHWGRWILLLVLVGVAAWLLYDKVGSKPAGVSSDTTKAVRDTFLTTKTGNKKW
jgi:hypothetical protein